MWIYSKKLQYPISIKNKDLSMAKFIITQFGGPNGELAASTRYITQRYTCLLYTSPSPRDRQKSRMPSSA